MRAAALSSSQKLEKKSQEVGAVQGQLAALEGTVSQERDVRLSEVQNILASAAAGELAMREQIAALQSKYDSLLDKYECGMMKLSEEDARMKESEAAHVRANQDLRLELERSSSIAEIALSKHNNEMAALIAVKEGQQEALVTLTADYRKLESELSEALEAKNATAAAAASVESRSREQIAVLSTRIDGLVAGLKVKDAQSAGDEQKARDLIGELEREKSNLSVELERSRVQSAAEQSELSVKLAVLSTKHEGLAAELEKAEAQAAVDVAKAEDHAATLSGKIDGLLAELHSARELAATSVSDMQKRLDAADAEMTASEREKQTMVLAHGDKLSEMKNLVAAFTQRLKEAKEKEAATAAASLSATALSVELSIARAAVVSSNKKFDDKEKELLALQCSLDKSTMQIDDLSRQLRSQEEAKSSHFDSIPPVDSNRELSALQFRLNESMAQVSVLSRQVADSEDEVRFERSLLQAEVILNEKLQKQLDLLRSNINKEAPVNEMGGIITSLTATLKEVRDRGATSAAKIIEMKAIIDSYEEEAAAAAESKSSEFSPSSGKVSCYLCHSTIESLGADEDRNKLLNAEAARVRAINEDLIAEIAAEERKTAGLSTTAESFSFENPMGRSKGKASFRRGDSSKGADESKSDSASEVALSLKADLLRDAETKQRAQALADEIALVMEENELRAKDLAAARSQRELLVHAIAAEEEMALSLQDRAAEVMVERSLRSNIAIEEEKALSLLSGATASSRDRFEAATAMFESEKARALVAEKNRLEASEALAKARERNDRLLATLTAEEERGAALQKAAAQAILANKERASTAAMTEKTAMKLTAALNERRIEIAEKERQLEIQTEKARRLTLNVKDVDDAMSTVSGSVSPSSLSPKKKSDRGWMTNNEKAGLEDFRDDSDSGESNKSPLGADDSARSSLLKKLFKPPSALNVHAAVMPSKEMLRSPAHLRPMGKTDVIPMNQSILTRGGKADAPRIATAMENEAKIVAEKIRSKRDAIRNAVDGILTSSRPPTVPPSPAPLTSCGSSISSMGGTAKTFFAFAEKTEPAVDDDDESVLGPLKAASQSLVRERLLPVFDCEYGAIDPFL